MKKPQPITIGVSRCLLGHPVRYDGRHKCNTIINKKLTKYFRYIAICPEMAIGLGVPRPAIRLVGSVKNSRAVGVQDPNIDVTDKLKSFGQKTGRELTNISGYILKKDSPSCGMHKVNIYGTDGKICKQGTGLFAKEIIAGQPYLPVADEAQLATVSKRNLFLIRTIVYHNWQQLKQRALTPSRLRQFHHHHRCLTATTAKFCVYSSLNHLITQTHSSNLEQISRRYIRLLMQCLLNSSKGSPPNSIKTQIIKTLNYPQY